MGYRGAGSAISPLGSRSLLLHFRLGGLHSHHKAPHMPQLLLGKPGSNATSGPQPYDITASRRIGANAPLPPCTTPLSMAAAIQKKGSRPRSQTPIDVATYPPYGTGGVRDAAFASLLLGETRSKSTYLPAAPTEAQDSLSHHSSALLDQGKCLKKNAGKRHTAYRDLCSPPGSLVAYS